MSKQKRISAEELDRLFDEGQEDILQYFDLSKARRPNLEIKRVNVDLPQWMINVLDREAGRLGVTRQSVIKTWLDEKIAEKAGMSAAASAKQRAQKVAEPPAPRYRPQKKRKR